MRVRFRITAWVSLAVAATLAAGAEVDPSPENASPDETAPVRVGQGTLPNPVLDEVTLIHRQALTPDTPGPPASLPAMITVRHETGNVSYAWDPVECRLLFAWRGDAMTDLLYVAEGPAPLAASIGVWGPPDYFGYRLGADGVPEFLYHYGRLAVVERLTPLADGSGMTQHWEVTQASHGLQVAVPERWKGRVKASTGSWSGPFLRVSEAESRDFTLTWTWPTAPNLPELPPNWVPAPAAKPETKPEAKPEAKPEGAAKTE